MSLRKRLTIIAAASVAVAVLLALVACYAIVRSQLRGQVDDSLRAQAQAVQNVGNRALMSLPGIPPSAGGPAQYAQEVVAGNNDAQVITGNLSLPVTARTRAVSTGSAGGYLSDFQVGDSHL